MECPELMSTDVLLSSGFCFEDTVSEAVFCGTKVKQVKSPCMLLLFFCPLRGDDLTGEPDEP